MRRLQRGVTLIELMVGIALVAILASIAVPSFDNMLRSNRVTMQTNSLLQAFSLARSEAVKTRQTVRVCPSTDLASCANSNNWASGWIVIDGGGNVIQAWDGPGAGATVTSAAGVQSVRYHPSGMLVNAAAVQITHEIAGCTGNQARVITIGVTGQASVAEQACSS